jgi:ATP-binding cassette subfamily B protein
MNQDRRVQSANAAPGGTSGQPGSARGGMGVFSGRGPIGMPGEKAKNFTGTMKRLTTYLKPQAVQLGFVVFWVRRLWVKPQPD